MRRLEEGNDLEGTTVRCVGESVRNEVPQELAEASLVPDDQARGRSLACHRARRVYGSGVLGSVRDKRRQVDRLSLERASLVEAREQQQVVDEACHPGRLAVDSPHRRVEVGWAVSQSVLEQLRVAPDGGERGPQLVRRVRHETSESRLGSLPLPERRLDAAQHHVERSAEPSDLGAVVGLLDALAQVAGRDLAGSVGHLLERAQAEPDYEPGRSCKGDQDRAADQQLEREQVVQRRACPGERYRLCEHVAVAQAGLEHAVGLNTAGAWHGPVDRRAARGVGGQARE